MNMIELGVNIDHVATLRQARYRDSLESFNAEPDPVLAALSAEAGGADGITLHLRADRRHIQDRDLPRIQAAIKTKCNLEMGNTPEILEIALALSPQDVCLVPEERQEVTTEGGLDCITHRDALQPTVAALRKKNIRVSMFIDPVERQVRAAAAIGAQCVELHTGAYANADPGKDREKELQRLLDAGKLAHETGLIVNAGHGLNYNNVRAVLEIPGLRELNIGHSIVSRSIFVGMEQAVREMKELLK